MANLLGSFVETMRVFVGALLTPLLLMVTSVAPALAQSVAASGEARGLSAALQRVRVEVSIWGKLSETDRASLLSLLATELSNSSLQLVTKDVTAAEPPSAGGNGADVLMRVILDVRSGQTWTMTIVDVARNKALHREQAGPSNDAAALEATVSILGAAASALREGFELTATTPVAPVVSASPIRKQPAPRATAALLVTSSLGARLASFDRQVPVQAGPATSLGLRFRNAGTVRLRAAHYFAASFASQFGSFKLDRTQLALDGGFAWTNETIEAELSLGLSTELLRRRAERAAPGVAFGADVNTTRIGGELLGQLRYRIFAFLAVEAVLGAAYFPKPIRFVASVTDNRVLTEPFKLVGMGGLALELRAP